MSTPTTEIYTLSLHDALPISLCARNPTDYLPLGPEVIPEPGGVSPLDEPAAGNLHGGVCEGGEFRVGSLAREDRKSTRLNSSHTVISYAVFCLKKKKKNVITE